MTDIKLDKDGRFPKDLDQLVLAEITKELEAKCNITEEALLDYEEQLLDYEINAEGRYECKLGNCKSYKTLGAFKGHRTREHTMGYVRPIKNTIKRATKAEVTAIDSTEYPDFTIDESGKYVCELGNCTTNLSSKQAFMEHRTLKHKMDKTVHRCKECDFTTTKVHNMKPHMSMVHNIGVKWNNCTIEGCNYRAKAKFNLNAHTRNVHDIGTNECGTCCEMRRSKNKYQKNKSDPVIYICNKCFKTATGKNSRKETVWSNYLDKEVGIEYNTSSDKSTGSQGGCGLERPDKLYVGEDYAEIDELDEFAHKGKSYGCDNARMSRIISTNGLEDSTIVIIRTNPDSYKPKKDYTKMTQKQRFELHAMLKLALRKKYQEDGKLEKMVNLFYIGYDYDSKAVCKEFGGVHIHDACDFPKYLTEETTECEETIISDTECDEFDEFDLFEY